MDVSVNNVDETRHRVTYDDISITLLKENGYVDITELCESRAKSFVDWLALESSNALICELESLNRRWNTFYDHRGMVLEEVACDSASRFYVHHDLAASVASWICPLLAAKLIKLLNGYIQYCNVLEKQRIFSYLLSELDKIKELNKKHEHGMEEITKMLDIVTSRHRK